MHAILFGFGTVISPPLATSPPPFPSFEGLRARLLCALLPIGLERSLKYPSGGVFELDDILTTLPLRPVSRYNPSSFVIPRLCAGVQIIHGAGLAPRKGSNLIPRAAPQGY